VLYVSILRSLGGALDTASALRQSRRYGGSSTMEAERRKHISHLARHGEQQLFAGKAIQAQAAFDAARSRSAQARHNFKRTQVRSPVNGIHQSSDAAWATTLRLGNENHIVIDADRMDRRLFEGTKRFMSAVGAEPKRQ